MPVTGPSQGGLIARRYSDRITIGAESDTFLPFSPLEIGDRVDSLLLSLTSFRSAASDLSLNAQPSLILYASDQADHATRTLDGSSLLLLDDIRLTLHAVSVSTVTGQAWYSFQCDIPVLHRVNSDGRFKYLYLYINSSHDETISGFVALRVVRE